MIDHTPSIIDHGIPVGTFFGPWSIIPPEGQVWPLVDPILDTLSPLKLSYYNINWHLKTVLQPRERLKGWF